MKAQRPSGIRKMEWEVWVVRYWEIPHCVLHIAHIFDIMTKALQQQQARFPLLSPTCSSWALATI